MTVLLTIVAITSSVVLGVLIGPKPVRPIVESQKLRTGRAVCFTLVIVCGYGALHRAHEYFSTPLFWVFGITLSVVVVMSVPAGAKLLVISRKRRERAHYGR